MVLDYEGGLRERMKAQASRIGLVHVHESSVQPAEKTGQDSQSEEYFVVDDLVKSVEHNRKRSSTTAGKAQFEVAARRHWISHQARTRYGVEP